MVIVSWCSAWKVEACDNEGHPRHRKDCSADEDANFRLPAAKCSVHCARALTSNMSLLGQVMRTKDVGGWRR
jgi:hypothetical protein